MNDEIKHEILMMYDLAGDKDLIYYEAIQRIIDYITNLQQENERLKDNQVRVLNKIKDYVNASECEIKEGNYNIHGKYWKLFNQQLKDIKNQFKGINVNDYVNIPKWREKELLKQEEQFEDYKSRIEKAVEYIKNNEVCCLEYIGRNEITGNLEKQIQRDLVNRTDLLNILNGKE